MDMIDAAIDAGKLETGSAYKKWKAKVQKTRRPKNPLKRKAAPATDDDLVLAIQKRVRARFWHHMHIQ